LEKYPTSQRVSIVIKPTPETKLAAIFVAGSPLVNCFRLWPQKEALVKLAMF
jgi:hypothetical protein